MQAEFGAPTSLEDFERKAQMLDYVSHRAIFEGMNAHLWSPNSGRMLWMTQPAWASTMWQIFSHDYDTQASYYGVQKACEPLHIQLDLSNYEVAVVNTTMTAQPGLSLQASIFSLDNQPLFHHQEQKDIAPDSLTDGFKLDLPAAFTSDVILVKLELHNAAGQVLSQNLYWLGAEASSYRQLVRLPAADVTATAVSKPGNNVIHIHVQLRNRGNVAALENKLTVLNTNDLSRVLPVYLSDNYVSLLPGETREIDIDYPLSAAKGFPTLTMRGWNLASQTVSITEDK
jgi:Exo-beta-D-glucosaminidase Ig-fold domain